MKYAIVFIAALMVGIALDIIHNIDAELDRQEAACKVPTVVVRRIK